MKSIQWHLRYIYIALILIPAVTFAQQPATFREIADLGRGAILAAAWSPDALTFAVSGGEQGIWIYDQSLHDVKHLTGRAGASLAWKADGKQLATANIKSDTGSLEHMAYVWDVASDKLLWTLQQPDDVIYAVTWTPDSTQLITRGQHSIQVWDAASGALLHHVSNINGGHDLSYSPDAKHILISGYGPVSIRSANSFAAELEIAMPSLVTRAAWSPDSQKIAITSAYAQLNVPDAALNALQIRDAQSGKLLSTIQSGYADAVAWSPDGRIIATGGGFPDFELKLWDAATGILLSDQFAHRGSIHSVIWGSGGALLTASADNTLRLWHWDYEKLLHSSWRMPRVTEHHELLQGYSGSLTTVVWSANGKQLATGSSDGAVRIWDVLSRQPLFTLEGHARPVQAVAWNAEGNQIAEGGFDGTIHIWNSQTGAKLCSFVANVGTNDPPTRGGVSVLAWHPNGQYLASGGYDGKVNVWDIRNSCAERQFQWTISQRLPVSLLDWSVNNQQLMTSDGMSIQLYSTRSGQLLTLLPFERRILSLALSPDKLRVALTHDIGEAGQVVELRDAATFQIRLRIQVQDIRCQLNAVQSLVWSPNGQQLAGICGNNKVVFWDSRTGKTIPDLNSKATGLTWSPDSRQIATVGEDGIVRLWSRQEKE